MQHKIFIIIFLFIPIFWMPLTHEKKPIHAVTSKTNSFNRKLTADEFVNVRVLSQLKIISAMFAPEKGSYLIYGDGRIIDTLPPSSVVKLTLINDSIEMKAFEFPYGRFKNLKFVCLNEVSNFKVKCLNPERKPRHFDDNLVVSTDLSGLKLINNSQLDHYIAGVSEAEAGSRSLVEFYKVQAILARTYALAHLYKHGIEGYNLCDQVHCQAFFGKSKDAEILQAVSATKGQVVVDEDMNLITAAFYSNSGGQTVSSEDVWGTKTTYLKSVRDTFSNKMPNSKWERRMLKEDWLSYLKIKHNFPVEDNAARDIALNFKQDTRKVYLEYNGYKVPLKLVRADLQLKSTFFSIEPRNDTIVMRGRGFGHGIGMSQEGAMRMTKLGYNYKQVLNFYYQNVHLIDLKELHFFKE